MMGTAGGNIAPSRFVKRSATADAQFLQAGTGDRVAGISGVGTRYPPYANLDDGFLAVAGENVHVYIPGEDLEAQLELGGTVAAGDYLKSDTNGKGVTAAVDGDEVGGRALMAGTSGQIITVQPLALMRGA